MLHYQQREILPLHVAVFTQSVVRHDSLYFDETMRCQPKDIYDVERTENVLNGLNVLNDLNKRR